MRFCMSLMAMPSFATSGGGGHAGQVPPFPDVSLTSSSGLMGVVVET
jgi:hypothetical protein